MAKKKKEEGFDEILDRIDEDLQKLRDKVWEMEADDQVEDEDFDDEDEEDEEQFLTFSSISLTSTPSRIGE